MALITINAVVDIPAYFFVVEIGRVIAAMATGALEDGVVVRINVARGAHVIRVTVIRRERRVLRVIERGPGPRRGVVAGRAGGWEELRLGFVARVRRVVVVRLMAANARDGQRRVIVVDVAVRANPWRHQVRARQGECGVVVVESRVCPNHRVMAQIALSGEACRRVPRIGGSEVVLLVARVAQHRVQRIVIVHMAVDALPRRHRVRSGQREARGRVVKLTIGPQYRVVAVFAGRREPCMGNGSRRGTVVLLVARVAGCATQRVVVVDMAVGALPRRHRVGSIERKPGAVVVEGRIQPGGCVVARAAGLREVRSHVTRICGSLIVLQVTRGTGRAV